MKITIDTKGYVVANRAELERSPDKLVRTLERPSDDELEIAFETCKLLYARYSGRLHGVELEAISVMLLRPSGGDGVRFFPRFTVVLRRNNGEKIRCVKLCTDLLGPRDNGYVSGNIGLCARYVANHIQVELSRMTRETRGLACDLWESSRVFDVI